MTRSGYSEGTLVKQATAEYLEQELGWESVYAYSNAKGAGGDTGLSYRLLSIVGENRLSNHDHFFP